jgi:flavin reductase (DIM6/NTAB) family NADH-FMN oxidoreductase RutF
MASVLPHPEGRVKDAANNIFAAEEFVVGLVLGTVAAAINIPCIDAPPGTDDLQLACLEAVPSTKGRPPRVAASLRRL